VRVRKNATDEFELPYDKLVIATGGAPAVHIPGSELGGVFTCNDLAGTIRLRDYIESRRPQRAVIAGSGYIGLEVADAFASRGIAVAIFERSTEMVEGIEPEIAARIEAILEKHKVSFSRNATVTEVVGGSRGEAGAVHLADGKSEDCDLVLLATGIVPRTELAESAGVRLGATGAIEVDERMLTSVNAIYAAGDCTEVQHLVTGRRTYFPLGTTANKQGRVAGENASGGNATFAGVVGTLVTKVFELEVAKTGLSLAQARAHGFQPDKVAITSTSRAKYFHGKPLDVTLVWDRTSGRLLGCQMAGQEGAAKRIDVAAMALHARMRIPEMLHLDLSYAPPFAPVWEAILIAAHEADKRLGR
jgi:NADPH-dependent 2,4-dienoyl-CoA reductase/sulfur reductase-like enzyme